MDEIMRQHLGRSVTTWQVTELLEESYGRAATVQNVVSGFRNTGLWPLDMSVFQDSDFAAAEVTDADQPLSSSSAPTTASNLDLQVGLLM